MDQTLQQNAEQLVMRERTALIGGHLEIMSEPGQGSVVRLVLDPGERSQRR